jgi:phosphatidylserine/phosphatidylglycerophosphate/cardiolipin synthase-like enzyme
MLQNIIHNQEHYTRVIERARQAKKRLWIGTADIKDLHVKSLNSSVSFLSVLSGLVQHRVDIRILHAKAPGANFKQSYAKYPLLEKCIEMALCIRVHFKIIIIDSTFAYFGSANLTGAGLGLKSENNRNFETGLITNDESMIQQLEQQFDKVWMGRHCPTCGRKAYCKRPLINLV